MARSCPAASWSFSSASLRRSTSWSSVCPTLRRRSSASTARSSRAATARCTWATRALTCSSSSKLRLDSDRALPCSRSRCSSASRWPWRGGDRPRPLVRLVRRSSRSRPRRSLLLWASSVCCTKASTLAWADVSWASKSPTIPTRESKLGRAGLLDLIRDATPCSSRSSSWVACTTRLRASRALWRSRLARLPSISRVRPVSSRAQRSFSNPALTCPKLAATSAHSAASFSVAASRASSACSVRSSNRISRPALSFSPSTNFWCAATSTSNPAMSGTLADASVSSLLTLVSRRRVPSTSSLRAAPAADSTPAWFSRHRS
mmetsp:Transcript_52201/g.138303  ORF Transcript_52201/g.138303 Transcript_52201/m.138303 type:complete len:319 (+) Transcript_52201:732-1688(+)